MNYYIANLYPNELYHYGVKGMRWGVRKQRNLDLARRYGQEQQKKAEANRRDYSPSQTKKEIDRYKKKYSKTSKWLDDMYGNDWKNKSYMKDVFNVDDVHKHAREGIRSDLADISRYNSETYKMYTKQAKTWADRNKNGPLRQFHRYQNPTTRKLKSTQNIKSEKINEKQRDRKVNDYGVLY